MRRSVGLGVVLVGGVACGAAGPRPRASAPPAVAPARVDLAPVVVDPATREPPVGDALAAGIVATGYTLDVDLREPGSYQVTEVVRLRTAAPIDQLWLHAADDVVIQAARVERAGGLPGVRTSAHAEAVVGRALVRLQFAAIPAGDFTLTLQVAAPFRTGGGGLVRVGEAIVADLSAGARRAWPCIDRADERAPWHVRVRPPDGASVVGGAGARPDAPGLAFRATAAPAQVAFAVARLVRDGDVAAPATVFGSPRVARQASDLHMHLSQSLDRGVGEGCSPPRPTQLVLLPGLRAVLGRRSAVGLGIAVVDAAVDVAGLVHGMARVCFGARAVARTPADAWLVDALAAWAVSAAMPSIEAAMGWTPRPPPLGPATPRVRRLLLASLDGDDRRAGGNRALATVGGMAAPAPDDPLVQARGGVGLAAYAAWLGVDALHDQLARLLRAADDGPVGVGDLVGPVPGRASRILDTLRDGAGVPRIKVVAGCRDGQLIAQLRWDHAQDVGAADPDDLLWRLDAVPVCVRSSAAPDAPSCVALDGMPTEVELPGRCSAAVISDAGLHVRGLGGDAGATLIGAIPFMTPTERDALAADLVGELAIGTLPASDAAALVLPSRLTGDAPELEPVWRAIAAAVPRAARARWQRDLRRTVQARVHAAVPRYARDATSWRLATALPDDAEVRADLAELTSWRAPGRSPAPDRAAAVGARLGWACGHPKVTATLATLRASARARDAELVELVRPTLQLCTLVAAAQR